MTRQGCENSRVNSPRLTIKGEGLERNGHRTGASCGELMAALAFSAGRPAERLAGCAKRVITAKERVLGRHRRPQRITCGHTITAREIWSCLLGEIIDSARSIFMRTKPHIITRKRVRQRVGVQSPLRRGGLLEHPCHLKRGSETSGETGWKAYCGAEAVKNHSTEVFDHNRHLVVIPSTLARFGSHPLCEITDTTLRSFGKERHLYISVEPRLGAKLYASLDGVAAS